MAYSCSFIKSKFSTQHDNCIQVVFAFQSILVVRARSLHLFPYPVLKAQDEGPLKYTPTARHSFGWVDGVSVKLMGRHLASSPSTTDLHHQPLSILVRAESDDPWSSDILAIELYTLQPNPDYHPSDSSKATTSGSDIVDEMTSSTPRQAPYIFPPVLASEVSSRRGDLRCTHIILGRLGTAVWIQPRDRFALGLYWPDDDTPLGPQAIVPPENKNESLVAAVFPGSLSGSPEASKDEVVDGDEGAGETKSGIVCWNERNNWSSVDYDEDVGRIVLGSSFGRITILDL